MRETPVSLTTNPFDDDKLHEECGIFGVYGHIDSAALTALGLHALQHRGQEAARHRHLRGWPVFQPSRRRSCRRQLQQGKRDRQLPGASAIGHNRYSTTGDTVVRNIQPLFADFARQAALRSLITAI